MRITTLVFALITTVFVSHNVIANDLLLQKDIVLYKGSMQDPYVQFYDFDVPTPGPVVGRFIFKRAEPSFKTDKQDFGQIIFRPTHDAQVQDSNTLGTRRANKVNKTVDAYELERFNGKYRVMLTNITNSNIVGRLIVRAPRVSTDPIDLGINRIFVNRKGYLAIEVENFGDNPVPQNFYGRESPVSLMIFLPDQGRSWGGASLPIFDEKGRLRKPGGKTTYVSNLRIGAPTRVQVNLRFDKDYKDGDVQNNTRVKTVGPTTQGRPDLRVSSVFLEGDRVGFILENRRNAPLPDKFWATRGKEAPVVIISINNLSKGNIALYALPNAENLDMEDGTVRYISNIRVPSGGPSSVAVTISDPKNLIGDRNRSNNRMQRRLRAR
jgi:hypothetical protein